MAAYNLINEPAPEKRGGLNEHADSATMRVWYRNQTGGARDLRLFYETLIKAVRIVDAKTPDYARCRLVCRCPRLRLLARAAQRLIEWCVKRTRP